MPAQAGIQGAWEALLDARLRGHDSMGYIIIILTLY